ncbi:hypothetical protein PR202_ga25326 [Eleusine coracana subsp. coracana]|uniref:Uncharacterized protein n=1 Tax=Eleusine coracana subsp. coracana TaxID=191504 RepID=A0AAV5DAR8_ELECO|nr:hypothetical protein PR202_ga25326 [Eleusine coracana subsp. coracana]
MPSPDLACLQPPRQHLFRLQINRCACGGLIIASSSHHQAADGYSMSTFFNAWVDAVGAGGAALLGRPVVPYGPGALVPRRPPHCEFEHRGVEFLHLHQINCSSLPEPAVGVIKRPEIINTMLHYSSESVAQLKAIAENKYTTFETITAHLWRKITIARGRADAEADACATKLDVSVNGRARLGVDSLPQDGFFGNVVLTATSKSTAKELARGGADEELEPVDGNEDYALSSESWLHLDLHKLDFGCGGRLLGVVPPRIPLDGVLVLIPNLHKGDGVDVFVALCDRHAKELRNIAYTLD